ncbi:MAG: glycosyltransferase family 4 protein [Anaerolineae bacterium]|jgi:glycosyltransferase involved in cell wall biosynthesis|nr:glycosyltransferase family 4 protein [Anaerolineae bacterium]
MPEKPRPRLLVLESLPTISGGQQVLLDMIPALRAVGDLRVLLPAEGPLSKALGAFDVPCTFASLGDYTLVQKTLGDVLAYAARLPYLTLHVRRLIRSEAIDLVYANSARTFVWGTFAAALAGRPILWHHHNLLGDEKTLALLRTIGKLPAVRRILCVSEAAARQFPALAAKTVVIPNGVDTEKFRPVPAWRAEVRNALGISGDAPVVGMVGDLIALKGQHVLLEAVQHLPAGVHTVIVGDPRPGDAASAAYGRRLREMAGPNVHFLGRREDLPEVLNALDLLVVASERETGPLVLLEGLACGVPALSTPVGRAPDLLSAEMLFPVGDSAALEARLQDRLAEPQKLRAAGDAARSVALQHASLERFQSRIREEIEATLAPRKSLDNL